jgi:hypothetical protein
MINNRYYERKGQLYKNSLKKSLSDNSFTFKPRQFVLQGENLFYYKKKGKSKDQIPFFNLISLKNARLQLWKELPPNFPKQYKHCFCLESDNLMYTLASKNEQDMLQWVNAIYAQIQLVSLKTQILKFNSRITSLEIDKAVVDRECLS